jgi:catechol-2,3-dioxygenase
MPKQLKAVPKFKDEREEQKFWATHDSTQYVDWSRAEVGLFQNGISLDHIVVSVKDLKKSVKFYETFLGKARVTKWDASWDLAATKFFLTSPYKKSAKKFDKGNLGLNHIAFKASSVVELKRYALKLQKAKIKNSGIQIDKYSNREFIWFDDPDGIRLEFYLR